MRQLVTGSTVRKQKMNSHSLPPLHPSPWNGGAHIGSARNHPAQLNLSGNTLIDIPGVCFHGDAKACQVDEEDSPLLREMSMS